MQGIYIVAAKRTPIGRFNGGLAGVAASELGATVVRRLLAEQQIEPGEVSELVMGQVLTAGGGQNPARQAAMSAGLPVTMPAYGVSMVCGSGQKAVHLGAQAILAGNADLVVAGGQESMSRAPHLLGARRAMKYGDVVLADSVALDGLTDAFHGVPMGATAEHLARQHGIAREAQDRFALQSHARAITACALLAEEIVPIDIGAGRQIDSDEQPRADSSATALAALVPAFGATGTVTAGNASSLNDGAAALVLASERAAKAHAPLARIAAFASAGVEPMEMGMGAAVAARLALERAGWRSDDLDLIELNEAFAAQALAVIAAMGWDEARVNVNGGGIALGHPIGASGCRIVVTLLHEMQRRGVRRGLATLCIGGGQGVALCLER